MINYFKFAICHRKQFTFTLYGTEDFIEVLPIGIGYEYLTKSIVAAHHLHNSSDSARVKFVEDIVKKKYRSQT